MPESVTYIGGYAFSDCTGLTSITLPESVTSIGEGAFSYCTGLTSITLPESVTSIGRYAFNSCTGLTSVTLPSSLTSIGRSAFAYCSALASLTSNAVTPPQIESNSFASISGSAVLRVPDEAIDSYKASENWSNQMKSIIGLDDVSPIAEFNGFTYCANDGDDNTASVVDQCDDLPEKVEFASTVTINGKQYTVTDISSSALKSNSVTTEITIPATIKSLSTWYL